MNIPANKFSVRGKFLYRGDEKFYIKGVTYGTFKPDAKGNNFPDELTVIKDFELMAEKGINCTRTYTVPPEYVFDAALRFGISMMVGLPWEQHITFLDDTKIKKGIINSVRENVVKCINHPAVLCFTI